MRFQVRVLLKADSEKVIDLPLQPDGLGIDVRDAEGPDLLGEV